MKATFRVKDFAFDPKRPHIKALVRWKNNSGRWERKFFPSKGEAKAWAEVREIELKDQGTEALSLPSAIRVMALECQKQLDLYGKTLRDATAHYIASLEREGRSVPMAHAALEFIAAKRKRKDAPTERYIRRVERTLRYLVNPRKEVLVEKVTSQDICDLRDNLPWGAVSVNGAINIFFEFFGWSMAKERNWCSSNPVVGVDRLRVRDVPAGIVSPEELKKLLMNADAEMLVYVAIGAFAGLRSAEICRLNWKEIDLQDGYIEVTAAKSKTATRRVVKIHPALRTWIEPFAQPSGPVCASSAPNLLVNLWRKAGLTEWPRNALRHSFASYHLAMFKDAAALALEMGHSTTALIFKHYRQVVRHGAALEFWSVLPPADLDLKAIAEANPNLVRLRSISKRVTGCQKFSAGWPRRLYGYTKSMGEYMALYGIKSSSVQLWMIKGYPLDDPKAMEQLRAGRYSLSARQHAEMYGVNLRKVSTWRRGGWPLDDPERVRNYLESVAERKRVSAAVSLQKAAKQPLTRIIPMPTQQRAQQAQA